MDKREIMMEIEENIENISRVVENHLYNKDEKLTIGLLSGGMGMVLFFYYHAKLKGKDNSIAEELLSKTLDACTSSAQIDTFCNGIAGVGFGIEHLNQHNFIETETNILLADADEYLNKWLNIYLNRKDYDFLHASIGLGVYFLKRSIINKKCNIRIESIIHELKANLHKESENKVKWLTAILNTKRGEYQQVYNISISHGMSAILYFLVKSYTMRILKEEASKMLNGVVEYILNQEIDKDKYGSYFPSYSIESDEMMRGSRLGWCYGDLGTASVLYQAGVVMQNDAWKNKAIEVLLFAAKERRDLSINSINDAGLCHGTAGVAHIFYRTWWNTRLPEFKRAADYWFSETLKMAKFSDGLAGYKAWKTDKYGGWVNEYGVLEGVTGIGLAMLSYITETEPIWDECLLLS